MNLYKCQRPVLLCKACQSGKTGEALNNWVTEQRNKKKIEGSSRKIGIFICDNSLLLTKQTSIRAHSSEVAIEGDIVTISCKAQIKRVDRLYKALMKNNDLTTVLCCGNTRRLKDISELLQLLIAKSPNYELFIYIDEADKILHSITAKMQLEIWRTHPLITQITLITATPQESLTDGLAFDFGELSLLPVKNILDKNYHSLYDSILIDTTNKGFSNVEHAEQVFETYAKDGPTFGEIWFIPGEHTRKTHDEMQTMLFERGFNCILKINGKNKEISYLDEADDIQVKTFNDIHEEILHGADELEFSPFNNELSRWLERYYIRNNGKERWKFAITGNVCISRGISIQSPGCMITHAIFGPKCSRSQTGRYQMFARVCGNIKHFPGYLEMGPPKIFCEKDMFNQCCKMEQQAIYLAELSQKNKEKYVVVNINNMSIIE